jgi:hypothetical protein
LALIISWVNGPDYEAKTTSIFILFRRYLKKKLHQR